MTRYTWTTKLHLKIRCSFFFNAFSKNNAICLFNQLCWGHNNWITFSQY